MTKNRVYELMLKCDKNLDNIFENYEACISSYREEQINEILRYVETTPTAALDYDFLVLYKYIRMILFLSTNLSDIFLITKNIYHALV